MATNEQITDSLPEEENTPDVFDIPQESSTEQSQDEVAPADTTLPPPPPPPPQDSNNDEEEYDPTAAPSAPAASVDPRKVTTSGIAPSSPTPPPAPPANTTSPANTTANNDDEEEEEDEYDPTSAFEESSKDENETQSVIATASNPAPISTATTASPTPLPASTSAPSNIDHNLTAKLTQKLFSDPAFLALSPAEQQKKVVEEFSKLQQASAAPSPVTQSQSQLSQSSPSQRQNFNFNQGRQGGLGSPTDLGAHRPNIELPMTPEESKAFNEYLENESTYNPRYPFKPFSRLFVGNLPQNFTKDKVFRIFNVYGKLQQISLKNTYAFLQYENPESVQAAIDNEYNVPLYGKDLVLEVAKGSTKTAPAHRANEFFESRKRGRDDGYSSQPSSSRYSGSSNHSSSSGGHKKRLTTECQIFVKQTADPGYARDAARSFENRGIRTQMDYLRPGQHLDSMVKDAAYSGVIGVVLVNKNRTVDCSIYQKTPDGGIRFDEYNSISYDEAAQLILREKANIRSPNFSQPPQPPVNHQSYNQPTYNAYQQSQPVAAPQANLAAELAKLPPDQLQALLALTQTQQQPQPQPYQQPVYNQQPAPQPFQQNALASILSKVQGQPQGGLPQQGGYGASSYQQPPQPQPVQQQQYYGASTQGNQGSQPASIQSLMDTLSQMGKQR